MRLVLALVAILLATPAWAACPTTPAAVCAEPAAFPLVAGGKPAAIFVEHNDWPGVIRAASDLQGDLAKVSGTAPKLTSTAPLKDTPVVIVGTLGRSALVERLAREGKLDVGQTRGRWEGFVQQVVERPLLGVERALVIAGADKRGTIFGIYDLSERMGVSPWTWWADVPVARRTEVHVTPGARADAPRVRYRGIFLNDEDPALKGWADKTFGGFNHRFYGRVFELTLRLKGNFLWPAMWGKAFPDDDPLNARLADEWGVVIGTSHHEPMMRAHVEWERYGEGPWDYAKNPEKLRQFWREGMVRRGDHESLVTIGMRGDGDEPMTEGTATALLDRIVEDQRTIIGEVTGKPAPATPQVWALYKEVQDYYDKGMRVPSDVTLLFADDNWGNIRRLPKPGQAQAGGFGVYYHFDYVGGPRNYKWLNTNQIERVWEQMGIAYATGADRIWIVNVGDLKPMEYPINFFLDYAWNPEAMTLERLTAYPRDWAEQQLGQPNAGVIGHVLTQYTRLNARRKPELLAPDTFSLVNFGEAERVLFEWEVLEKYVAMARQLLKPEQRDAFAQLVEFPVEASANLNRMYVAAGLNRLYAAQGRAAANAQADEVRRLFARDAELTRRFHTEVAGGKWDHMMAQTHIGYTSWQQPERNVMPQVRTLDVPAAGSLGVAVEGDERAWPSAGGEAVLPPAGPYGADFRWIEVFNRGAGPLSFTAEAGAPWVHVSETRGPVGEQRRLMVSADWTRAPVGEHRAPIRITGSDGTTVTVVLPVYRPATLARAGFAESDGHVAMEAAHGRTVDAGRMRWRTIPNLGRTWSGLTAVPVTAPAQAPGAGPRLEYPVHLVSTGEVEVHVSLAPTLDFKGQGGLRYAVAIDDEPPQVVNIHADETERRWEKTVAENIRVATSRHRVAAAGAHVVKLWVVDPGLVFERVVVAAKPLPASYLGPPESCRIDARLDRGEHPCDSGPP